MKQRRITKKNATKEEYEYLLNLGIDLSKESSLESRTYYDLDEEEKDVYYTSKDGFFCQNFILKKKQIQTPDMWVVIVEE